MCALLGHLHTLDFNGLAALLLGLGSSTATPGPTAELCATAKERVATLALLLRLGSIPAAPRPTTELRAAAKERIATLALLYISRTLCKSQQRRARTCGGAKAQELTIR